MTQFVYYSVIIIFFLIHQSRSEIGVTAATLKIVVVAEQLQPEASGWFLDTIKDVSSRGPDWLQLEGAAVQLDRENPQDSLKTFCSTISLGTSLVLDLTWSPWTDMAEMLDNADVPVVNSELGEALPILEGLLQLLAFKNATDAVLIFEKESVMEHALYKILGSSVLRILALFDVASRVEQLRNMRPIPNYFVIIGTTNYLKDTYKMMVRTKLLTLPDRWILASTDLTAATLDISVLMDNTTIISLVPETNCWLQGLEMPCADELDNNQMNSIILEKIIRKVVEVGLATNLQDFLASPDCSGNQSEAKSETSTMRRKFMTLLTKSGKDDKILYYDMKKQGLYFKAEQMVSVGGSRGMTTAARWFSGENIKPLPRANITSPRRFLRIGAARSMPWTYVKLDEDGKPILDEKGEPVFEGYCIDLIAKLAEVMDFDYEIVKAMHFGKKLTNGTWDGLIGDLAKGDTDIAVAAIIMTSQREEVVDFVAPYFDQTGLSIVIRKPVRKTSLFKFMTVLRVEVWLSIVGALTLTAILLTVLDKYSPYSSRNNKDAYPYPCREFTLKESLWFALTSFTPQGGGEAPKALSSRALVAAYWLFVVLMLATFTANLAAFLTVERMQTPVSSLEQLARQSRINYTVVEGSMAHKYFINMKNAEDTLYRVWKEITLNASSDEVQYQVWDYPVREQYGHILLAINSSSPLRSTEEGFRKVDERLEADFAFIHDSSEIKYQVKKNCNLTIVGEVFGERPLAVAVQQGSRIQEELSRAILQLQKDRFLDSLIARYWNTSCEDSDNSEGITLDSLGGVFIATLFGLVLALITLVWEIFYYKRKENIQRVTKKIAIATPKGLMQAFKGQGTEDKKQPKESVKTITFGDNFKAVKSKNKNKVSFINVEPKLQWNP